MNFKKSLFIALSFLLFSQHSVAGSQTLTAAKAKYLEEDFDLNIIWNAFPSKDRSAMKQAQKQWIKNKDSVCGKISAKANERKLISIYDCHTKMTRIRAYQLGQIWDSLYN